TKQAIAEFFEMVEETHHRPALGFLRLYRRFRRLDQLGVHESYLGLSVLSVTSLGGSAAGCAGGCEVSIVGAVVGAVLRVVGAVVGAVALLVVLVGSELITFEASLITSKLSFCSEAMSLVRSMPDSCISFWKASIVSENILRNMAT